MDITSMIMMSLLRKRMEAAGEAGGGEPEERIVDITDQTLIPEESGLYEAREGNLIGVRSAFPGKPEEVQGHFYALVLTSAEEEDGEAYSHTVCYIATTSGVIYASGKGYQSRKKWKRMANQDDLEEKVSQNDLAGMNLVNQDELAGMNLVNQDELAGMNLVNQDDLDKLQQMKGNGVTQTNDIELSGSVRPGSLVITNMGSQVKVGVVIYSGSFNLIDFFKNYDEADSGIPINKPEYYQEEFNGDGTYRITMKGLMMPQAVRVIY